jgi:hypothetical protein
MASSTTMWLAAWVAPTQGTPQNHGPEFGGSSPIGLVVILVLAVAVVFLVRSMNKHLRKVPDSFDPAEEQEPASPGGSTPGGAAGGPENTQSGPEGAPPR